LAPAGAPRVQVQPWRDPFPEVEPGDVVVEAFGCDPPPAFVARMAARRPAWLNLEYLSAEAYVERSHGLPSPVMQGPGAGLTKRFFYPGFTARTGGLLRERDLATRRAAFDGAAWLRRWGIAASEAQVISLFCYEPRALPALLEQLARQDRTTHLLVTAGRATAAVKALGLADHGSLRLHWLPLLSQREYDELLWSCDLNFVRGEDSVVRGLLAGVPCVWQIYPQQDLAHHGKLDAFLAWLQPPPDLRDFFLRWNDVTVGDLPAIDPQGWIATARDALAKVDALPELAGELLRAAAGHARI
jgi:uncharacterized repeat protein (TIGR03837 family)